MIINSLPLSVPILPSPRQQLTARPPATG